MIKRNSLWVVRPAYLRATFHTRLRTQDQCTSSTLIGGKVELVQVRFTLHSRDQRSKSMQDGCKVYINSYMASNGSCYMITWTIFQNHLLEVGLTQNHEIMALRNLTTVDLLNLSCVGTLTWAKVPWNNNWFKDRSHMASHYAWGTVTTLHAFGSVLGRPLDTSLLGYPDSMVTSLGSCVYWPSKLYEEGGHFDIS